MSIFDGGSLTIAFTDYRAAIEASHNYAVNLMVHLMRQTRAAGRSVHITANDGSVLDSLDRNTDLDRVIKAIDSERAALQLDPRVDL